MTEPLPGLVQTRLRKKWSLRAKLIGYGLLAGSVGLSLAGIFLLKSGFWIFFFWSSGFAIAFRYLRVADGVQRGHELLDDDATTVELMKEYEQNVLHEGRRELAHGTLSIPDAEMNGELSMASESGALSTAADESQ